MLCPIGDLPQGAHQGEREDGEPGHGRAGGPHEEQDQRHVRQAVLQEVRSRGRGSEDRDQGRLDEGVMG